MNMFSYEIVLFFYKSQNTTLDPNLVRTYWTRSKHFIYSKKRGEFLHQVNLLDLNSVKAAVGP